MKMGSKFDEVDCSREQTSSLQRENKCDDQEVRESSQGENKEDEGREGRSCEEPNEKTSTEQDPFKRGVIGRVAQRVRGRKRTKRVFGMQAPGRILAGKPDRSRHSKLPSTALQNITVDYEEDVMKYLLCVEGQRERSVNYLNRHPAITVRIRAILLDWLIQVQTFLGLQDDCIHLSAALMDRVFTMRRVSLHKLQLFALITLFITAKLHYKTTIKVSELLQLTLNSYTMYEFLCMEKRVLIAVDYRLVFPVPSYFLAYFLNLTCYIEDNMVVWCANMALDVCLLQEWTLITRPSLLAAGTLHAAITAIRPQASHIPVKTNAQTPIHSPITLLIPKYFNLSGEAILSTSLQILEALANRRDQPYMGAEIKYSSRRKYEKLARNPLLQPDNLLSAVQKVKEALKTHKADSFTPETTH